MRFLKALYISIFLLSLSAAVAGAQEGEGKVEIPCPEGKECVLVDTFTRTESEGEVKTYEIGGLTASGGFFSVVLLQEGSGKKGAILQSLFLTHRGRRIDTTLGEKAAAPRMEFPVSIPRYSESLSLTLAEGKGAVISIVLERPKE